MDDDRPGGLTEDQLVEAGDIDGLIRESIEKAIGDAGFQHAKLNAWSGNVVEGCLKRLSALQKPFKYIVTCNLMQKTGGGLHTASTSLWDPNTDGKITVQWENNTMHCIVTVYWLCI
mmetsp:Transcript_44904/g.142979  ORF Transcript_44904/g.142979 Transcript_44904/m.142979 type:complete len:117 (+) Transcript_44904:167-517(+)